MKGCAVETVTKIRCCSKFDKMMISGRLYLVEVSNLLRKLGIKLMKATLQSSPLCARF